MTKRIVLVIGCSFSRAFNRPGETDELTYFSWPELLAKDTGATVWNFSHYCNSTEHQSYQLNHLLREFSDTITDVVVQYTTSNRTTMVRNLEDYNLLLSPQELEQTRHNTETYWEVPEDKIKCGFTKWNGLGLMHMNANNVHKRWRSTFEDMANFNMGSTGPTSSYIGTVLQHDMRRLIESYGIRCLTYKHYYHQIPLEELLYHNELPRDRTYMDFILQHDMPDFDDLVIDNGFHFGIEGCQRIVDDYIRPGLEL